MTSRAQNNRQDLVLKGTATVPGLAFQGDNNTGIYSPGANEIAISTGGIPALAVDSAQRLTLAYELAPTEGGTGLGTYTTGDILYASATDTLSKLAIGTNGQILTVASGVPAWTAAATAGVSSISFGSTGLTPSTATTGAVTVAGTLAPGYGGTGLATYTAGDILYATGAGTLSRLAVGTDGQVLTVTAGAPAWGSGASAGVASISFGSTGLTPSTTATGIVTVAGILGTANGGTNLSTFGAADRALYSTSASVLTAGTLPIAAGGTGATSQSTARTALGLGSIATQASSSVSITGGTISTSSDCSFGKVTAASGSTKGFVTGSTGLVYASPYGVLNFTGSTSIYGDTTNVVCQNASSIFWTGGTGTFTLGTGVQAYKDGGGSWVATSDSRVKKNVQNYVLSTSELLSLRPVTYQYNGQYGTPDNNKVYVGLIAQEVLNTPFSSMVGTYNYEGTELLNLDPSQLIYALINAVQELNARINALENKAS